MCAHARRPHHAAPTLTCPPRHEPRADRSRPPHPAFYVVTGGIRGESVRDSWNKMKGQYIDANLHAWQMWVVADAVNFALVPLQFRVIFACSAEFVWVCVLSIISNRDDASDDKEGKEGGRGGGKRDQAREVDARSLPALPAANLVA